ncbi:MAG: hypothetical protein Q8N23_28855 [Archangium sp.]|nr:hypothetical protein [Archangium sp.]MDP3156716.1 hypothetical protein [Archangium sp.]MDP3574666.1 hypothetical protein [Archangium sp.]
MPCLLLLCGAGCGWALELFPPVPVVPDAGPVVVPWGEWVQTLSVPACATADALVVNTIEDEAVGGARPWETWSSAAEAGPTLSLREALWIAWNHPGPDTILFDAAVFPSQAPATVRLGALPMPVNLDDFCLDARGRGVLIGWGPESVGDVNGMWRVGPNSLMVGVSFVTVPSRFRVFSGQLVGCRFLDEAPGDAFFSIDLTGGTVGPGNVFAGPGGIAVTTTVTRSAIVDNFFGVDPRTAEQLPLRRGVMLWGGFAGEVYLRGNTFLGNEVGIEAPFDSAASVLIVERNDFFSMGRAVASGSVRGQVGPLNTIRDSGIGVQVTSGEMVITRNSISGGGVPIAGPGPSPTGLFIDGGVGGVCPGDGLVELFSDANAQAEEFLGEASCDAQRSFFWPGFPTSGRTVSATFTALDGGTGVLSAPVLIP